jgi:tripartite-type tricarboxylate transporter receptor subunit TctC
VIERMNREIVAAIAGELGPKLAALGTVPRGSTPQAFKTEIDEEVVKWSKIIEAAHIKLD